MAGLKQLSGSMLTGSDPGLLAEVTNEYPDASLKSYSSTSDLYSHHKYSVSNTTKYSVSEQSLVEMGRDKVTEGSLSEDSEVRSYLYSYSVSPTTLPRDTRVLQFVTDGKVISIL